MVEIGTILWAKNRPADHGDHLHVEPPTKKTGTPPLTNPGMTSGVQAIFDALVIGFGPAHYLEPNRPGWSHMGWYNRRKIAGTQTWSQHAYANAIDIGPYYGVAEQQRFYDFLTGVTTPIGEDMLTARLMVVEAGAKTWLETQASIDYWMLRADNLNNPTYAAEWRADFEQMWAREKQNEWLKLQGHPHGAAGTPDLSGYAKVGHDHNVTGTAK